MKNTQIYNLANSLSKAFQNCDLYIPAKINFAIQKNMSTLLALAQEIEQRKIDIGKHYGVLTEDGTKYDVPQDKIPEASQELEDLFAIEQDVDIRKIKLDDLDNISFTPAQMQALMFMIEED